MNDKIFHESTIQIRFSLAVTSTNPVISDQQIHYKIRELNKIIIRTHCVV
ncbi:hypothetical protein M6B38_382155 [Iris pallida]|uniref:Uncharacterized protein n=1 Tax=Iris pallida TaxID=29817 RepID=A0AAX6EM93_IRIPA|nr:hypothetical protein M6B38_181815 [Iris pallida]KAJ6824563.1 hypothetical protein M6B38_382155 [Iris pallida]